MFPKGRLGAVIVVYVAAASALLVWLTFAFPLAPGLALPFSPLGRDPRIAGLLVWILVGLATSSRSSVEEGRMAVVFGVGPIVAVAALGGPAAAAWVALIGSTEKRELTGGLPWWAVLANHAMLVVPAGLGGLVMLTLRNSAPTSFSEAGGFISVMAGAACFSILNVAMAFAAVRLRTGRSFREALGLPVRALATMFTAESTLGWVFAAAYQLVAWWSPIVLVVADVAASASLDRGRAGWLVRHNQLTSLPNRLALSERARDFARQRRFPIAVFYLDLDNFKAINDTYDHDTGDHVLEVIARRLDASRREDDFLAHLHGDEFVLLAPGVATIDVARAIGVRLSAALDGDIAVTGATLTVRASIGAQIVESVEDLDRAIRDADRQMQLSKRGRPEPSLAF